jgi:response regulator RpfG family c-di-GMP phosphodiesterase
VAVAGKRPTVLLVDDEPAILRALTRELSDVADVTSTSSVTEALVLVANHRYDIVVADLRLPDRWGDELLAHVAARSPSTRRLLLTADQDPQRTVRELIDQGVVQGCYRKPWTDELIAAIRTGEFPSADARH